MRQSVSVAGGPAPSSRGIHAVAAFGLVAAAGLTLGWQGSPAVAPTVALLGMLAVALAGRMWLIDGRTLLAAIAGGAAAGVPALAVDGAVAVWQVPRAWAELVTLSPVGAALAATLYLGATLGWLAGKRRPLPPVMGGAILAVPFLFNGILVLASPDLTRDLGRALSGAVLPDAAALVLGRAAVLVAFNEIVAVLLGLVVDRHWLREARLHALLAGAGALAAATPLLADWASGAAIAALPALIRPVPVVALTSVAQAGLWAETFLVTGFFLDALRGRRPTLHDGWAGWRDGLGKGAVYSAIFMAIVQAVGLVYGTPSLLALVQAWPIPLAALGGALLFPLAVTVVETFDGSASFVRRLAGNAHHRLFYLRGLVIGTGIAVGVAGSIYAADGLSRFAFGFLVGAGAYAGVDLLRDLWSIAVGPRARLQSWRIYALGAVLGGVTGGAVAWYLETAQLLVIGNKLLAYATVHYPSVGRAAEDYVIYPLFSKWGAMNLGAVTGGARLFFDESLSGVINWSLAAPLFSINLVVLTALVQRRTAPLKALFSTAGLVGLVEQAIRVLRWGLWMAPVVYSFLRLSPDPTWYNQDGAVRTVVASVQSVLLGEGEFRAWSLELFLGLLAYDWLRILIWFDHMGLRVATLVNLSFVGGDLLDEKAARFIGHSGRTRCFPEGIRRFATWAPLLLPFYIPRGAEWDRVWTGAEQVRTAGGALLPAVTTLVVAYGLVAAAVAVAGAVAFVRRGRDGVRPPWQRPPEPAAVPTPAPERFALTNGGYSLELWSDGRGFARVAGALRGGADIDLNPRPDDALDRRGKLFYLQEVHPDGNAAGPLWSLGRRPVRAAGAEHEVRRLSAHSVQLTATMAGIRAEALVRLADDEPVETWRIRLANLESRPRTLRLTSYQELVMGEPGGYARHPALNAIHIGTGFVRPLGAILARNRLLKSAASGDQPSREVAFHAVRADEGGPVRLLGYEDSRARFIGHATLGAPAALDGGARLRAPEDEGLLYGFDPAASLGAEVRLPAGGSVDVVFVDGWAEDAARAAETIARYLGVPVLDRAALDTVLGRNRELLPAHERTRDASPFVFSADGKELRMGWNTPRPWAHVLANPLGHGTVVSNDGASFSFAGNAQQNALTPFALDSVPVQQPGQLVYVVDLDTGEADTPTFVPYRRVDARHEIVYGRGYATFVKERGDLELRLTHFVPPELPLELRLLEIRNHGYKRALYRVVSYAEIVLAETPAQSRGGLVTEHDRASGTLLFANPANDFRKGWAFATTSLDKPVLETVRARVLGGAEHDLTDPCLVTRGRADPAQRDDGRRVAAFSAVIEVGAGETARVAIVLGQAATREAAIVLARTWRDPAKVVQALADTQRWWNATLSGPEIATNQPAFDRLVNHWLPYQLLTARLWGRTGPSQRSGAYGFRDQLQDVLPLVWSDPLLARRQLLLHAAQQFLEGDVLQWWHTSWEGRTGLGSRSRIADIQLWLPYVAARYVEATGDRDILAETVPFLEGKGGLPTEGEGYVFVPRVSRDAASLYEHCRRAIELALDRTGLNGLPLALTGDWNDGLDRVGFKGRGESVWLGFFLLDVLERFAPAAEARGDGGSARRWQAEAVRLRQALDAMHRGDRYVRAVTDAGEELAPMDALMASWPVLSGAADLERGRATVTAALAQLEKDDTVLLLTPPFTEESRPYPGRITRYPPGVRENGGQYSHGVSWLVDALVRLADLAAADGDAAEAARLRSRALEVWVKIAPIHKTDPGRVERYGLPPHQQPADIYWGPGYEGRGGWSWYTGAAARMLSAAYAILGLRLEDGELVLRADAFAAKGPLQLQRVVYRGQVHEPGLDRPGVRQRGREAENVMPVA